VRISQFLGAAALQACACVALAADETPASEKFSNLEPAIQMLRAEASQDRREIVRAAMLLTQSEGAIFWSVYDQYREEMRALSDRRLRLISDFAATRNTMSEVQAEHLTREALSIDMDKISIKEDYVRKMSKVLSARIVARFFQIDAKLDAVVDADLAARIPLVH
jgi:hypothetical protein